MLRVVRGVRGVILSIVLVVGLSLSSVASAWAPTGTVERVNVAYDGGLANNEGQLGLAVSADGRYVAFASAASNLVEGDTNDRYDIFWRDLVSQETTLVNQAVSGGFGALGAINFVDMTPDGRYVLFSSPDALIPNDTNGYYDVFVRDMVSQETTRVSTASDGAEGNWNCGGDGSLSDDGRMVAYFTDASNMYAGDMNGKQDVILKNLESGESTCVSRAYDGGLGNGHSFYATISGNGAKVAFVSYATNMVSGDVSGEASLFIRDLGTGDIERVDATTSGGESASAVDFQYCDMDYTGRRVVFASRQTDIVDVPVGTYSQIYLRDTESDETTVVALTADGNPANEQSYHGTISGDGRWVSFVGGASNLVDADTNGLADVFLRDMEGGTIERVNFNEEGGLLDRAVTDQKLSDDGSAVVFNTAATNIGTPAASGTLGHIYLRVLAGANTAPVALADTYTVLEGATLSVAALGVLDNDDDADGDGLTADQVGTVYNGTLNLSADGSFTYTPDAGFAGSDTFTYRAFDGTAYSDVATVTITVNPLAISIAGDNRFDTAVKASERAYPDGLALDGERTVVIATGMNWPDALGGTSLAGALDGPVLLVNPASVPASVMAEITRLKATKAIILGGTGAVSAAVEQTLKTELGTEAGIVRRIDGANRYETADKIAREVIAERGASYEGYAFVATGANFPDALAAAPLAAANGWPLYLVHPNSGLLAATKTAMADVSTVVILGGTGAVSESSETYLQGRFPGQVTRLDGNNRYQTAAKIAKYAVDTHGHTWNRVGITTGANFPDALAGGIVQGKAGSVMLLTTPTVLQTDTNNTLIANKDVISTVTFFGGTGAVSQTVRDLVAQALQ